MHPAFEKRLTAMNAQLAALVSHLEQYTHTQLNTKPAQDAWSAMQVMQHLMVSEKLSLQYIRKKTSFQSHFKKAGWMTSVRRLTLKIFLWAPLKFKAPPAVNADVFSEEIFLKEVIEYWLEARNDLAAFLGGIPDEWIGKEVYRHPRAGRMTLDGMLDFFEDHFARHRKQIIRTLKQVSASSNN